MAMCHLGAGRVSVTRLASGLRGNAGEACGSEGCHWIGVSAEPEALSIHPHGVSRLVRAAQQLEGGYCS